MKYISVILFLSTFISCSLERNVEIDLPPYENELVVESYLEPDKPILLSLSESISYFELPGIDPVDLNRDIIINIGGFEIETTMQGLIDQGFITAEDIPGLPPTYNEAVVTVTHKGVVDTLENILYLVLDPRNDANNPYFKYYNFISRTPVIVDYDDPFYLSVIDLGQSRAVTGEATFLPPVAIDSTRLRFNTDNMASFETWLTDPPQEGDFYRVVMNRNSLYRRPFQTFAFNDDILTGAVVLGTGYDFESNDTIISTIFKIDEGYHDFYETFEDAVNANGNPFAQPTRISSTVLGGIGIFTALTHDRDTVVVP